LLREKNESLRQQAERLAQLSAENERLSNRVTQAQNPERFSDDQFRELLRLRSQVGQLRQTTREMDGLRATNQQLLAALGDARKPFSPPPSTLDAQTNRACWTREQLTFVGYADPESAMKTTLWAWVNSDPNSFLAHCTPEERAGLEKAWAGRSEAEIAALFKRMAGFYSFAAEGARVLGNKSIAEDEAILDLYFERDGKSRRFVLKKSADKWKVDGLVAIFD
jgi:hypothetical protein